jgi:hypothetical protein
MRESNPMTDHSITLTLSEPVYAHLQQLASQTEQPVEKVLEAHLIGEFSSPSTLPEAEQSELDAFRQLSDETLWTIAREQTSSDQRARIALLLALNKRLALSADEEHELDELLAASDRVMLRKAEAAALLTQRGYTVTPDDMVRRE